MSQHKYASNVVEKCLEYGDSAERELLVEEIIGQSDKNDTLLVSRVKSVYCNSLLLLVSVFGKVKKFVLIGFFLFKFLASELGQLKNPDLFESSFIMLLLQCIYTNGCMHRQMPPFGMHQF